MYLAVAPQVGDDCQRYGDRPSVIPTINPEVGALYFDHLLVGPLPNVATRRIPFSQLSRRFGAGGSLRSSRRSRADRVCGCLGARHGGRWLRPRRLRRGRSFRVGPGRLGAGPGRFWYGRERLGAGPGRFGHGRERLRARLRRFGHGRWYRTGAWGPRRPRRWPGQRVRAGWDRMLHGDHLPFGQTVRSA